MSYSRRSKYSRSPSPYGPYSRSRSSSRSRDRDRSPSSDVENPGNNLYVTGLSPRITKRDLERHFASEGKVIDVHLVVDPWTRESRGFGFVTMSTVDEADSCIKYLNRSVLEGRVISVERAKRRRGRTPTPGRYLGLRTIRGTARRWTPSYSPRRSPSYTSYRRSWSRSPRYSSESSRSRSYSPNYRQRRSYSPYCYRRRLYSPYYNSRRRSYSKSPYSRSPVSRRDRSYAPYDSRYYSPDERCYRRHRFSWSPSPRRGGSRRSYSSSISPRPRRSRRSYSRSISPASERSSRSYSRSLSPGGRNSTRRSYSGSISPKGRKNSRRGYRGQSEDSFSRSPSESHSSGNVSRSVSPRSPSPST